MPPKKTAVAAKEKAPKKAKAQEEKDIIKEQKNEEEAPKKKKTAASKAAATKSVKKKGVKDGENEADQPPVEAKNGSAPKKRAPKTQVSEKAEEVAGSSKKERPTKAKKMKEEDEANDVADEPEEEVAKPPPKKTQKRKASKTKDKESEVDKKPKTAARTNATITDWEAVNFKCSAKTSGGKAANFHITSWNVDGLRAWVKKGGLEILKHDQPDIFCVQETKCAEEKLPSEVTEVEGYETLWCSSEKDGYAGVGVFTKIKPVSVIYGVDSEEHDGEGRCITAEYEKFYLVNVYVPNAGRKLVTLPKRLEWNKSFKAFIKKLDEKKPVIICGDMNVAHTEIDLANPKTNTKNAGFTIEEREGMTDFLQDGYVDTFRQLYPDREKAYTFWTYMANARTKNVGWRLDYFIVSEKFMKNVCDNIILHEVLGSDHCPITLHVNF